VVVDVEVVDSVVYGVVDSVVDFLVDLVVYGVVDFVVDFLVDLVV
jgi:hypothetical protein